MLPVLLIIFMVIALARPVGLDVRTPQTAPAAPALVLVITVLEDGGALLNREKLGAGDWPARLRTVLANRADHVLHRQRRHGVPRLTSHVAPAQAIIRKRD